MFTVYAQLFGKEFVKSISFDEMVIYLKDQRSVFWIDVQSPTDDTMRDLQEVFDFHPLCIEDCMTYSNTPKIDEFEEYLFLVMHEPTFVMADLDVTRPEIDFFLGRNYLVSVHHHTSPAVEHTIQRCNAQLLHHQASVYEKPSRRSSAVKDNMMFRNSDFVLHAILDRLVDAYLPLADEWDDQIGSLEARVLTSVGDATILGAILNMKRRLSSFRRIVSPQRDVLSRLLHSEHTALSKTSLMYFRDVYDHLIRVNELVDSQRDAVASVLDAYYSVLSHQMNVNSNRINFVMQRLTIITTIFMPLSFIAGVYGMNFEEMPGIHAPYGYYVTVGLMLAVSLGLVFFFKKKGWF